MSSTLSSLWLTVFDRNNAYDALFANSTPGTIHCISRTCRVARRAVLDYTSRAFDINDNLHRFVANPDDFRRMQLSTGCIISGSFALQFMDRTFYPGSDMDLYVDDDNALAVGEWILEFSGRGYRFAPRECQADNFLDAWGEVPRPPNRVGLWGHNEDSIADNFEEENVNADEYGFTGYHSGVFSFYTRRGNTMIQLIACKTSPMNVVLSFHSSGLSSDNYFPKVNLTHNR